MPAQVPLNYRRPVQSLGRADMRGPIVETAALSRASARITGAVTEIANDVAARKTRSQVNTAAAGMSAWSADFRGNHGERLHYNAAEVPDTLGVELLEERDGVAVPRERIPVYDVRAQLYSTEAEARMLELGGTIENATAREEWIAQQRARIAEQGARYKLLDIGAQRAAVSEQDKRNLQELIDAGQYEQARSYIAQDQDTWTDAQKSELTVRVSRQQVIDRHHNLLATGDYRGMRAALAELKGDYSGPLTAAQRSREKRTLQSEVDRLEAKYKSESQAQTARVDVQRILDEGGTVSEQLAKARKTRYPDDAVRRLKVRQGEEAAAARAQEDALRERFWSDFYTAPDLDKIPAELPAQDQQAAREYAEQHAIGAHVATDLSVYGERFDELTNDPRAFASRNLFADAAKLSRAHLEELLEAQAKARQGPGSPDYTQLQTANAQVTGWLAGLALDPAELKRPGVTGDRARVLVRTAQDQFASEEAALGRKLTVLERQGILDALSLEYRRPASKLWGMELPLTGDELGLADIPADHSHYIPQFAQTLRAAGAPVTGATIWEMYQRAKLGGLLDD